MPFLKKSSVLELMKFSNPKITSFRLRYFFPRKKIDNAGKDGNPLERGLVNKVDVARYHILVQLIFLSSSMICAVERYRPRLNSPYHR